MSCRQCGNELKYGKTYCSYKCQKAGEQADWIERWKQGLETGVRAEKTLSMSSHLRRWLLAENNNACSICGWDELHPVDHRPLVEVDHIDGDASNNRPENLRVLCPNCHSMTPTFRARNRNGKRNRTTPL